MSVRVRLPHGAHGEFPSGIRPEEVFRELIPDQLPNAIAARVNGEVRDLRRPLPDGSVELDPVAADTPAGWEVMRHSGSHILAAAVRRLLPGTKLAIGPAIEEGFYYDLDTPRPISDEDLPAIEAEMKKIVEADFPFERMEIPKAKAGEMMKQASEPYKQELIEGIPDDVVSFYQDGDFLDLCAGPHVPSTKWLRAFKLTKATGAYWRGDEKRAMLQRIYGTAFHDDASLSAHLERIEEAKRRDHRRLGKDLDLFSVPQESGAGLVHWHPNGAAVRHVIEEWWYGLHRRRGYQLVYTPHVVSEELYKISGHLEAFRASMFGPMEIDEKRYRAKPMNCPGHIQIFKSRLRSYRELPVRYAELGTVYRYEKPGVLHGMLRVRGFTIDDSHIFVAPDQLEEETIRVFQLALDFLKAFGFAEFRVTFSTRPKEAIGTADAWIHAEGALRRVLERTKTEHVLDEGGGAFYGPKISVEVKDCLGRLWQCSTVQYDFNLPERFGLEFIDRDGRRARPLMIHRALTGSLERFFGVLVEHYAGEFPVWLAPVQAVVANISKSEAEYARNVHDRLFSEGFRVELDDSNDRIALKIRNHTLRKVPYLLVVGKREAESGAVAVRERGQGDLGAQPLDEFAARLAREARAPELGGAPTR